MSFFVYVWHGYYFGCNIFAELLQTYFVSLMVISVLSNIVDIIMGAAELTSADVNEGIGQPLTSALFLDQLQR